MLDREKYDQVISDLHDTVVLPRRRDHLLALERIVRNGFFDINMFSRFQRCERDGRVPMVGRRDAYAVDGFILQQFAEVFV